MLYSTLILSAAKAVGVPGYLLLAICTVESNLTNAIVWHDGGSPSYGICQIKHETAKMMGYKGKAEGLMNPTVNARLAAKYLKFQLKRYSNDYCMAVAAYNAGSFNESKKVPGYPRNLKYLRKVQKELEKSLSVSVSCDTNIEELEYE